MIGIIAKLKASFLGLTVIAVGNALPDALTTIALSKQGYALMGLTGAYAGQLFGLLIGFGLAMLKKCLTEGPQVFDLFTNVHKNVLDIFVIFVALAVLGTTFIYGIANKYLMNKKLSAILFLSYIIFFITACAIQIVISINGSI